MAASLTDMIRVLVPAAVAFSVGILCTPVLTHYLYEYKAWKKKPGKVSLDDVRVYNRALSLVEVQRLYKMGK
jgi:hypothetical protein